MPLQDPIAVYTAASDIEAHVICNLLIDAGVEAAVVEDVSRAGVWMFGFLPGIHKPQVFVNRGDTERARPLLEAYERQSRERRQAEEAQSDQRTLAATCDECGQTSLHPLRHRGTVQDCPHCGAYMDVGESDWPADAMDAEEDES